MDAGSYSKEIVQAVSKNSQKFYIRANKCDSLYEAIPEILSITAVFWLTIGKMKKRQLYRTIINGAAVKRHLIYRTTILVGNIFPVPIWTPTRFICVPGKWICRGRQWILQLYTDRPYEQLCSWKERLGYIKNKVNRDSYFLFFLVNIAYLYEIHVVKNWQSQNKRKTSAITLHIYCEINANSLRLFPEKTGLVAKGEKIEKIFQNLVKRRIKNHLFSIINFHLYTKFLDCGFKDLYLFICFLI